MSEKYKVRDQDSPYFITFAVVEWVDVFTRQLYRDIVLDSLRHCQKEKGLNPLCLVFDEQSHSHDCWKECRKQD